MITIGAFSTVEEAYLMKSRLESAGFQAFVQNEYVVQNSWIHSNLVGGVRVEILDSDHEEAVEFLKSKSPPPPQASVEVPCPACASHNTRPSTLQRRLALLTLLLAVPVPLAPRYWKCQDCGRKFKVQRGEMPATPEPPDPGA